LIVSLIAIAIMGSFYTVGNSLNKRFSGLGCTID